jgi:hypothetical protein
MAPTTRLTNGNAVSPEPAGMAPASGGTDPASNAAGRRLAPAFTRGGSDPTCRGGRLWVAPGRATEGRWECWPRNEQYSAGPASCRWFWREPVGQTTRLRNTGLTSADKTATAAPYGAWPAPARSPVGATKNAPSRPSRLARSAEPDFGVAPACRGRALLSQRPATQPRGAREQVAPAA